MDKEKLKEFIETQIIVNGKFESQRLREKWLTKNNFYEICNFLKSNDLLNIEKLYCFLYNETGLCEICGSKKRFLTWKRGFNDYCEKCSRKIKNSMKQDGNVDLEIDQIIEYVKDKYGKYSTTKIKRLSNKTIQKIINRTTYLQDAKLIERIYHIEHNLYSRPKCEVCGNEITKFSFSTNGYKNYCSNKCETILNKKKRVEGIKKKLFSKIINKLKNNLNLSILDNNTYNKLVYKNDEYEIELFTLKEYIENNPVINFKHLLCGHKYSYNIYYQGSYKCPKCYPIRSNKQYEIYDFIRKIDNKNIKITFNDRKTINPYEIDILIEVQNKKIGIEYNSQMFHSFGKNPYKLFNNFDTLEFEKYKDYKKYLLALENGVQILNIFSSEWIDDTKREIWKSIIQK